MNNAQRCEGCPNNVSQKENLAACVNPHDGREKIIKIRASYKNAAYNTNPPTWCIKR